ncbi:MAG: hypothetical protein JWP75_3025 [Frondihabitans sp.]|nr:hypothetical protein [Frondihabitans sp.]
MKQSKFRFLRTKSSLVALAAVPVLLVAILPTTANASEPNKTLEVELDGLAARGIVVDPSFDATHASIAVDGVETSDPSGRAVCPDRAAVALTHWVQSGQGCSVVGTTVSTKVNFKWYLHSGSASAASVLARGFNSKAVPTFYECGSGTGRNKAIPWGKVASAKYIKMLANKGWGGIQWS